MSKNITPSRANRIIPSYHCRHLGTLHDVRRSILNRSADAFPHVPLCVGVDCRCGMCTKAHTLTIGSLKCRPIASGRIFSIIKHRRKHYNFDALIKFTVADFIAVALNIRSPHLIDVCLCATANGPLESHFFFFIIIINRCFRTKVKNVPVLTLIDVAVRNDRRSGGNHDGPDRIYCLIIVSWHPIILFPIPLQRKQKWKERTRHLFICQPTAEAVRHWRRRRGANCSTHRYRTERKYDINL